jgi:hypothetical protein
MEIRDPEGGRHLGWSGGGWWRLIFLWFPWIFLSFLDFLEFFEGFGGFWKNSRKGKGPGGPGEAEVQGVSGNCFCFSFFLFFLEKFYENCKNGGIAGMLVDLQPTFKDGDYFCRTPNAGKVTIC